MTGYASADVPCMPGALLAGGGAEAAEEAERGEQPGGHHLAHRHRQGGVGAVHPPMIAGPRKGHNVTAENVGDGDGHGDGDGDSQLKIITCGRKRERGRAAVIGPDFLSHPERDQKHDHEIDEKRNRDAHAIQGKAEGHAPFQ